MVKDVVLQSRFAALVEEELRSQAITDTRTTSLEEKQDILKHAFRQASVILPEQRATPHKPWITTNTLKLIDERTTARHNKDAEAEKQLGKKVKSSVQKDKRLRLSD